MDHARSTGRAWCSCSRFALFFSNYRFPIETLRPPTRIAHFTYIYKFARASRFSHRVPRHATTRFDLAPAQTTRATLTCVRSRMSLMDSHTNTNRHTRTTRHFHVPQPPPPPPYSPLLASHLRVFPFTSYRLKRSSLTLTVARAEFAPEPPPPPPRRPALLLRPKRLAAGLFPR